MKHLTLLLIIFIFSIRGYSQPSQTEAKAAYMLAEESYGKGDYKKSLDFLQQVKESLGASNCKVLYLEVMVTRELYPKLEDGGEKVLALINLFEKSPDYASFSEEKVLEVAKIKLELKGGLKSLKEKTDKENAASAALEKAFDDVLKRYGPLDVTMEQLDSILPSLKVKEWRRLDKFDTYVAPGFSYDSKSGKQLPWSIDMGIKYKGQIAGVTFSKSNKIFQYQSFLVYSDAKEDDKHLFSEADRIIKEYTEKLGMPTTGGQGQYLYYIWKRGERTIMLQWVYQLGKLTSASMGPVQLIETIQ